mmetsp:Transcript_99750/g.267848  ORF Transcript_99750/g.267848 Transcript_99750/m.267848 type:complete len:214 (-) Transcript_99750:587-1228(-)
MGTRGRIWRGRLRRRRGRHPLHGRLRRGRSGRGPAAAAAAAAGGPRGPQQCRPAKCQLRPQQGTANFRRGHAAQRQGPSAHVGDAAQGGHRPSLRGEEEEKALREQPISGARARQAPPGGHGEGRCGLAADGHREAQLQIAPLGQVQQAARQARGHDGRRQADQPRGPPVRHRQVRRRVRAGLVPPCRCHEHGCERSLAMEPQCLVDQATLRR